MWEIKEEERGGEFGERKRGAGGGGVYETKSEY